MDQLETTPEKLNLAAIDIGSHSVRLLIISHTALKGIVPLLRARRTTKLAEGFGSDGRLAQEPMMASIEALREYAALVEAHGARSCIAGATGVIRKAGNGRALLEAIRSETGIPARVLSENEEAFFSTKGALSALPGRSSSVVTFDLGGGSTEFLLIGPEEERPLWSASVFTGAATVAGRFLRGDPTEHASIREAEAAVRLSLAPTLDALKARIKEAQIPFFDLIGTAGTVTTLAAMRLEMVKYQPGRVNGLQLFREEIRQLTDRIAGLPVAARSSLPGLEKGREDVILGGALVVLEILRQLGKDVFSVCDAGLPEGLAIHLLEEELRLPHTLRTAAPCHW
ncbi:MAG: hypothetical protein AB7W37_09250 [Syntrophobacteraceae bacterium]